MSRNDSKIDLEKYKPSVEDARRIADEKAAQERLKRALDNPALDAALAEARGAAPNASARVSKPSPWAKGAAPDAEKIDKAALPSATAPAVLPERAPVNAKKAPRSWPRPSWSHLLAATVLVLFPVIFVFVVLRTPKQPDGLHDEAATTSAATPVPMPPMSASSVSAAPATAAHSAQAPETPAPTTSAAPTSVPSAAVPAPERPHGLPKRPTGSEDPHSDAGVPPSPKATAEPAPPNTVAPPSTVAPVSPPPPTASSSAPSASSKLFSPTPPY